MHFRLMRMSRKRPAVGFTHAKQFALHLIRDGSTVKPCAPWITNPNSIRMAELWTEEEARGWPPNAVGSGLNVELVGRSRLILILKLRPVDTNRRVKAGERISVQRRKTGSRALMHHQPVAVNFEFVAFGLTAKHGVILQDQACAAGSSSREEKCGGESTDA